MENGKSNLPKQGNYVARQTNCDHCGISDCCSPLDCLRETILKDPGCGHGYEYFLELAIAREFSRWVLSNHGHLLKEPEDLQDFHMRIEKCLV